MPPPRSYPLLIATLRHDDDALASKSAPSRITRANLSGRLRRTFYENARLHGRDRHELLAHRACLTPAGQLEVALMEVEDRHIGVGSGLQCPDLVWHLED